MNKFEATEDKYTGEVSFEMTVCYDTTCPLCQCAVKKNVQHRCVYKNGVWKCADPSTAEVKRTKGPR